MSSRSESCRRSRLAVCVLPPVLLAAFVLAGCGDGESESRQADRAAIESLVSRVNVAVANGDAATWCEVFSPESVAETFGSPARCRAETEKVIAAQDTERRLRIEGIAFEGENAARVAFGDRAGEANFSKVGGRWYLDLLQEVEAEPLPEDGSTSAENG